MACYDGPHFCAQIARGPLIAAVHGFLRLNQWMIWCVLRTKVKTLFQVGYSCGEFLSGAKVAAPGGAGIFHVEHLFGLGI